ncbi:MAG: extracellular solute-binding protein [Lachnospiraceae bacterium]|nr:extracellular solute-binding protein [Lachnospiraceae bacterium]
MKKRLLLALMSLALLGTLGGCQSVANEEAADIDGEAVTEETVEESGPVQLTVWAEEDNFTMLEGMIESFKAKYAGEAEFEFTLAVQSDSGLRDVLLGDAHAGPDVFHFPDDQLNSLIAGGILEVVPNADSVKAANTAESVNAASLNGKLYAYPMTADNGYFLYYNKDYLTEQDVQTLDGVLAAAEAAGKKFSMELNSGWYMYAFFGGAGMELGLNDDGVTNYCNWNTTEGSYTGLDVAESIMNMIAHPGFMSTPDGEFPTNAKEGTVVAAISGVWNAISVKEAWGDNYGAVKLPTFTCKGQQVQMSSFTGYKMVGVNSYSKNAEWAHKFAEWITNEENQTIRFVERNQGPSNINAAASDEVMKVPAIKAVITQSEFGALQRVGNNFWTPSSDFANVLLEGNTAQTPLQELLDTMVSGITASTVK